MRNKGQNAMTWDFDDLDDLPDDDEPELTEQELEELQQAWQNKRFDPKPFNHKISKKRIAIVDSETDPFAYGLVVAPFTIGFLTDDRYVDFWGDDCVKQFFEYLATLEDDYLIYAHNGGKFDFMFFLPYLDLNQSPLIMGGRLVKIFFQGQEFRDSYAILPMPLSGYQKDAIDYDKMKRENREKHRVEILKYQQKDCEYLMELVTGFHNVYGDRLTIAGAALPMLNSFHGFETFKSESVDERFRRYYFGGRNQCFETGVLRGNWKVYDRNSMYPAEMRDSLHPVSNTFQLQTDITDKTDFACIIAWNDNCLPTRRDDNSLDFTKPYGEFYATIHEIKAGLDTGTIRIDRVKHAWAFERKTTFAEFVAWGYGMRLDAKAQGDKIRDILYKFGLNSPYGKFALNPRKFKQWCLTIDELPSPLATDAEPNGWSLHSQTGSLYIWSRPAPRRNGFINVATAASITGAARADLHRNLALAGRPIYCDTDSIICEGFRGELDETRLGGWKLEATGTMAAIGGKKLYAIFDGEKPIKHAAKGVGINPADIIRVCQGETILYQHPVPNFKLDGTAQFTQRNVKRTGTHG